MTTVNFDDPDFLKYLFGQLPVHEVNQAYEQYLQETGKPESFDSWFSRLPFNPDLMNLIYSIYQYDQMGKRTNQTLILNMSVKKRVPKKPLKPITMDDIEAFSNFIYSGSFEKYMNQKRDQQSSNDSL